MTRTRDQVAKVGQVNMHLPDAWGYVVFADEADVEIFGCVGQIVVMGFEWFLLSDPFWYIIYNLIMILL